MNAIKISACVTLIFSTNVAFATNNFINNKQYTISKAMSMLEEDAQYMDLRMQTLKTYITIKELEEKIAIEIIKAKENHPNIKKETIESYYNESAKSPQPPKNFNISTKNDCDTYVTLWREHEYEKLKFYKKQISNIAQYETKTIFLETYAQRKPSLDGLLEAFKLREK